MTRKGSSARPRWTVNVDHHGHTYTTPRNLFITRTALSYHSQTHTKHTLGPFFRLAYTNSDKLQAEVSRSMSPERKKTRRHGGCVTSENEPPADPSSKHPKLISTSSSHMSTSRVCCVTALPSHSLSIAFLETGGRRWQSGIEKFSLARSIFTISSPVRQEDPR